MKKLSILFFVLVLCSGLGYAQTNLVTNFSWETGDTTGWTTCGGKMNPGFHAGPHHGSHTYGQDGCCGSWGDPVGGFQTIAINSGNTYDVSGWVKGCDGGSSRFGVGGATCGTAPTTTLVTNTGCSWSEGATQITGQTQVVVKYYAPANGGWGTAAVHFDDAYVIMVQTVEDWALY